MSIRGFLRNLWNLSFSAPHKQAERPDTMSLRDAFGPHASADIEYGSEEHEEIVNQAPRSFFEAREKKWQDRLKGNED